MVVVQTGGPRLFKYAPNRTRGVQGEERARSGRSVAIARGSRRRRITGECFVRGGAMGDDGRRRGGAACELCGAPAAVHCEADAAFLCAACDAKVHGANFLASRHRRRLIEGAAAAAVAAVVVQEEGYESAASSSCVSTADSASTSLAPASRRQRQPRARRRPQRRARAEAVLEGWAKRAALGARAARRCAAEAGRALRACGRDVAAARVPLRVAMAAALWWEVAADGAGQADTLRRLEACAHVPARLVMAVASSMGGVRVRRRAAVDAEEGWDECSRGGPKPNPAHS